MPPIEARSLAPLVAGALAIGFAPIFTKLAMADDGVGPIAAAFWRTFLAGIVLTLFVAVSRRSHGRPTIRRAAAARRVYVGGLILPGILFALDLATWHVSFQFTTAAHATLLANLQVVFVGLWGWLVMGERLSAAFAVGAALALLGVAGLLGIDPAGTHGASLRGNLWATSTAVFYASYLISIRRVRAHHTVVVVMAVSSMAASATSLGLVVLFEERVLPDSFAWGWLIALALVGHVAGQSLIAYGLRRVPVSLAGVTLLLQPVFAATLGALVLGEHLLPSQIAAGLVVVVGLEVARRSVR